MATTLNTSAAIHTQKGSRATIAFNMAIITLMAALVGLGLAYALEIIRGSAPSGPVLHSDGAVITKSVAGKRLAIPAQWFRFEDQKTPGFSEKIDLVFALPLGENGAITNIDVALVPRSRVRPSDRLLDSVYLHQFEADQLEGPIGLVGKPLKSAEGFQDETVWYDPLAQTPFVAKCAPLIGDPEKSRCLRTVLVTDQITATYAFDGQILQSWRNFDPEVRLWLSRIGGI